MSEIDYKTLAPNATTLADVLTSTGTTEDTIAARLPANRDAIILNESDGSRVICVTFNGVSTTTGQVAQTDFKLQAGAAFRWTVVKGVSDYVHIEEYSTSGGTQARVWSCGG